ncbi:terpene synthase family protein [Thermomonospora cellulosilytica]|uniref:Terpene synthase n=1 Tax=Thermomonospora cellulosilytica TaxID=1411118 RepID=A0A7W3N3E9_9ACTN|nr:terpene synthase family protein [Thermomonospora cellulosilytica]MBA9006712.1 hypothetical protein [Thermomonospora cellulosilytica]
MDAALVLSLADRVAALATRSGMHPAARTIGARADEWARVRGLVTGAPDSSPLGRARFDRLAGRIFPQAPADRVELFTRWLIWAYALDDAIDDTSVGGSATAVHGLYADLLGALRRGHAKPEARPLEVALAELWRETVPGTDPQWRRRFLRHMEEHRAGCAEEAVDRRTGRMPTLEEFPGLRRRAAAPFLFDLAEPVLGVALDAGLAVTPSWKALVESTADMITWVNDVISYPKETRPGAPPPVGNYVAVIGEVYRLEPAEAARRVVDLIARRAPRVRGAARALAAELDRLQITPQGRRDAAAIVRTLLAAPRAHLDWLTETGRYALPAAGSPVVPVHRQAAGLRSHLDDTVTGLR